MRWAAAATAGLLACAACEPAPRGSFPAPAFPGPPDPRRASLLLVSLDTFRADAAGCGGSPTGRTPHLDRLARTGVQFETGLAPTPLTRPSHASMLTGLDPPRHGIRDNGVFGLAAGAPTLAERLREKGFATGAFIAAFPLASEFGLDRGFDIYDDDLDVPEAPHADAQRDGGRVTDAARAWLTRTRGRRAFAFVHLFDAHSPPDAPPVLRSALGGDAYAADVAVADRHLGSAVRTVRQIGDFWVVVLGDHGESRGEHQEPTHGTFVYASTIRVPAVIWPAPAGEAPGPRRGVFRAIDFPATVYPLLGLEVADAPGDGTTALTGTPGPAYLESLYPYYEFGWAKLRGVQDGPWKYIDAPEPELYQLERDPGELRNVIAEHPDVAERLRRRLDELTAVEVDPSRVDLDDDAREALESLGYVAGADPGEPDDGTDRPDPKRMIRVQNDLMAAGGHLSENQPDAALQLLRRALARDPRNKNIHVTMGMANALLGRHDAAVDSFLRGLELPPHRNDRVTRYELASSYLLLREYAKAEEQLEIIVAEQPTNVGAWYHLGLARDGLGRRHAAEAAWHRALEIDPEHQLTRNVLGS